MIVLNLFCPECTLWLVLMLAGAWILGWIFWALLLGSGYRSTIKTLKTEEADLKKKNTDLKSELIQAKYEKEKRDEEYKTLRSKHGQLDIQHKALAEQLAAAKAGTTADSSKWDARIAELEKELAATKAAKEKLQADYNALQPPKA